MKKPTRVLTNMVALAAAIDRQCSGDHRHVALVHGLAKAAANCTEQFCNAIIDGVKTHLEYDNLAMVCGPIRANFGELAHLECGVDSSEDFPFDFRDDGCHLDDLKGGELPKELVREGRKAEMRGFHERGVYEIRPKIEA